MKLLQGELSTTLIGIIVVLAGLLVTNSKLAMLICLLLAVIAFFKKETGLLFLLIFIPIRPFLITVNPGFKIIGDAIIGFLFIRTLWDSRKDIKKLFSFHPFEVAFLAFAVIGVVSALITGVSLKAIITQVRAYYLYYLVFYVVKRMDLSVNAIKKMSVTTFLVGLVLSIQGIVEKISNKTLLMPKEWTQWVLSPTNRVRVYGLIKGPNELSLYLLIALIISLYLLKTTKGIWRYFIYVGIVLMGTTIFLTYSRGTILTLVVFLIVFIVMKLTSISSKLGQLNTWKPFFKLCLVAVVSFGLFMSVNKASDFYFNHYIAGHPNATGADNQAGADRFKNAFSDATIGQSNNSGRIYYVKKAIQIFKDHPILGSGFGTFGGAATLAYSSPIYKKYGIKTNFYSDNQYILVLAETGIMGIIAILMVIYFLLKITWNNRKEFYFPLLLFFPVGLIVGGTVYNILENDTFMMFYFIILGIALQKLRSAEKL